jgi:ribosomal protein S18 acetylase RimI-like enzyme
LTLQPATERRLAGASAGRIGDDGTVLRDFEERDQWRVQELILAGMRERWGARFDASANPDTADLWLSYGTRGGAILVVEIGGKIIATGTLLPEVDGSGTILRISVDRQHRRQGLARTIVAELVERARRRALDRVTVTTDTPWSDALALYRSCGFDLVCQTDDATYFVMSLREP